MTKKLINLTPHPITIYNQDNNIVMNIPPSGQVARVATIPKIVDSVNGVPIRQIEYGDIVGLPEPQPDTIYIVSTVVIIALRAKGINRMDVVSPDTNPDSSVRDSEGKIIGVRYFQR